MLSETRKTLEGIVVSNKMDKTVVVKVKRTFRHAKYGKVIRTSKKYKAHDEGNLCKPGDMVLIEACRPLSREKRWKVAKIIQSEGSKK